MRPNRRTKPCKTPRSRFPSTCPQSPLPFWRKTNIRRFQRPADNQTRFETVLTDLPGPGNQTSFDAFARGALAIKRVSVQSQGAHWQSNEFRCSRNHENAREGSVLKGFETKKGAQTQDLSPRVPRYSQKRRLVGDFSAPKLDSLPTRSQTLHRNSIRCQRGTRKCPPRPILRPRG